MLDEGTSLIFAVAKRLGERVVDLVPSRIYKNDNSESRDEGGERREREVRRTFEEGHSEGRDDRFFGSRCGHDLWTD